MTIEQSPNSWQSVNDSIVWVVSSTNVTQPNYKYIADIYIDSVLVFRSKTYADENDLGVFDLASVLRQYVNAAFKDNQSYGEFKLEVTVKFGEEYNGVAYVDLVTDTQYFANYYGGRVNNDTALAAYNDLPATDREKVIELVQGCTEYYLPYFRSSNTAFTTVINGVTTTITPTEYNSMYRINIAAPTATADYAAVIAGTTYNVKVICAGMYTNYYVHFLNQWGGWESMLFNKASKTTYNIDRKSYQQRSYRVAADGSTSIKTGNVMHEQKTTFGVMFEQKVKIATDWVSDTNYRWLRQLAFSPFVYFQDGDTLYSCQIDSSNYEEKTYNVDSLSQLVLDVSFGTKYKTQFR